MKHLLIVIVLLISVSIYLAMSSRHVQAIGSNTNMVQCTYSVHNIIFLVDEFERSIGCPALSEPEEITIVQHGKDHAGDCTVNVSSRNISM